MLWNPEPAVTEFERDVKQCTVFPKTLEYNIARPSTNPRTLNCKGENVVKPYLLFSPPWSKPPHSKTRNNTRADPTTMAHTSRDHKCWNCRWRKENALRESDSRRGPKTLIPQPVGFNGNRGLSSNPMALVPLYIHPTQWQYKQHRILPNKTQP
jgi:hypothetical protein